MSKQWIVGEEVTAAKLNNTGMGLHVVARSTPQMSVYVNDGLASVLGNVVKFAGGNSPTITAPTTNPRIDLIYINAAGAIAVLAGTEAASPVVPTYPTTGVVLAEIYLRPSSTAIYDTDQGAGTSYIYRDSRILTNGASGLYRQVGSMAAMDGTVTPIPVAMQSNGTVAASDADGGSILQKFIGFFVDIVAGFFPTFKYVNESSGTTNSLTIPAGNNLVLLVSVAEYGAGSLPSGYTFNGVAMTGSVTATGSTENEKLWYLALGTLASPLTANLVRTGGTIQNQVAMVYDNVDQANPLQGTPGTSSNGSDPALTATDPYNTIVCFTGGGNPVSVGNSGFTTRHNNTGTSGIQLAGEFQAAGNVTVVFGNGGAATHGIAVMLKTVAGGNIPTGNMVMGGVLAGFSGLTPGSDYYVSNTAGTISTTPGTTTIKVGKALSATELLIVNA